MTLPDTPGGGDRHHTTVTWILVYPAKIFLRRLWIPIDFVLSMGQMTVPPPGGGMDKGGWGYMGAKTLGLGAFSSVRRATLILS